jgi:hypothetical protein
LGSPPSAGGAFGGKGGCCVEAGAELFGIPVETTTARGGRTLCRVVGVLWLGATGVVGLAGAGDPATAGVRCGEEESGGGG